MCSPYKRTQHGLILQSQTVGIGLQVPQSSGGLLEATAHTGYIHVQQESLDPQVFDLGGELQGYSNQCPGLLLGSNNLAFPSGPSLSSGTGEGFRAADQGNSDLSGVEGSYMVASVGRAEG